MEFLYIERLRLLVHIIATADQHIIAALIFNFRVAKKDSWIYGAIKAVKWAQTQIGREEIPDELFDLGTEHTWIAFHEVAQDLKKCIKKVETAHQLRLETYVALKEHSVFQEQVFLDMGWTHLGGKEHSVSHAEGQFSAFCQDCNRVFPNEAALAVHQHKKHGLRIALRRFAVDATCRCCKRFLSHSNQTPAAFTLGQNFLLGISFS